MDAHILLSPVGQKTETRFNCLLTENRKSTKMMVEARCYQNDSWSARRVIGATAKPLYPIDGKAAGFDRRIPQDLHLRGRGTARGGGRSSSPVGARIARPFVPDVITTTLREDARRGLGAIAKPLYPIDVKAAGFDRRIPQDLPLRGRGTAAAVEGVSALR